MEAIEFIAIIIFILAVLILIYYYLQNNPQTTERIRTVLPESVDSPLEKHIFSGSNDVDVTLTKEEDDSMSKKIKVKLNDIDFNTDGFSKKIDAFLDEKSDQLIQDWSLATKDDLSQLEDKFSKTVKSVDDLEVQFKKFQTDTDNRFESIEKRIDALEDD